MNNDVQFWDLLSLSSKENFVHLSSISRLKGKCEKLASQTEWPTQLGNAPHRAREQQSSDSQKKPAHHQYREADSQSEHSAAPFSVNYLAQHIQQICGRRLLSQGQDRPQHLSEVAWIPLPINKQPCVNVALQTVSKAWSPIVLSTTAGAMNTWYLITGEITPTESKTSLTHLPIHRFVLKQNGSSTDLS